MRRCKRLDFAPAADSSNDSRFRHSSVTLCEIVKIVTGVATSQRRGIRLALITGFSLVLLLLAVVVWVGVSNMEAIRAQLNSIVDDHNVKKDLVTRMRSAARERTVNMYRMITLSDPFARDEEFLIYNRNGALFAQARMKLKAMPLDAREQEILRLQGAETGGTTALQEEVVDLAFSDELAAASELLYEKTVPGQDRVFVYLTQLQDYQTEATRRAEQNAGARLGRARTLMFASGGAALLVGALIALLVVRYTTQAEARLFRAKRKAVVTLHSIGEGVITTNAEGKINTLNSVASELTGWSEADAQERELMEVFRVRDQGDRALTDNPVNVALAEDRILNSDQDVILRNQSGDEFAVEYTVAPIRDQGSGVLGAVLVFRNVTELRQMANEMAYQATHDTLTGLVNRFEFDNRLALALQSARGEDHYHTLLYIDLDQFKVVNDTCGHSAGDALLQQLAAQLQASSRRSDTLARLGGDEFALLLANCRLHTALHTAEALCRTVEAFRFVWDKKSFGVSASIGVVEIRPDSGTVTDLLSAADNACYVAKDLGRNRVHVFQPDDVALAQRQGEMQWLSRIRNALEHGRFQLYYQRMASLSAGENAQLCEILLRMVDARGELVPPGAFIPAAERYGLMHNVDRWVIKAALEYLSANQSYVADPNQVWTINLCGQTIGDDHFLDYVTDLFHSTGVPPGNICFEITETSAVRNLNRAAELISELKAMGCRFALDDFGSGISSFTYLKHLQVDYLKIDGSFVKDMLDDTMNSAMVESINQIGQLLGLRTIAEWVEQPPVLAKLRALRVDYAQGNVIHRPEPLAAWSDVSDKQPPVATANSVSA
jgi:diguanylate cyclase (GGDEF)-like protein/PAS domain S-box-containing protein